MTATVASPVMRQFGVMTSVSLARTWRFRSHHEERWHQLVATGAPYIFLLWHEVLLPLLWRHRNQGIVIVVSEAREGRYLGDLAERIGYDLVHGSSTRGGTRALLGAIRALHRGRPVGFTPDGPRGPRRQVKPGIVKAAQRAGAMILPIHARSSAAWRMRSWDEMVVPKPFARVEIAYGQPFAIGCGRAGVEAGVARCGAELDALDGELAP